MTYLTVIRDFHIDLPIWLMVYSLQVSEEVKKFMKKNFSNSRFNQCPCGGCDGDCDNEG